MSSGAGGGSGGGAGGTGGTGSGTGQRGRKIYKLGTHKLKTKDAQGQPVYVEVPILSRALARVGSRLQLDEATLNDIRTFVEHEGGNAEYYKRGAVGADRILVVYQQTDSDGEIKVRQIQLPIPRWAPNYKLVSTLAAKANAAGLQLRGIRRHGYLIVPPSTGGGTGGGSGGTGGGTGG